MLTSKIPLVVALTNVVEIEEKEKSTKVYATFCKFLLELFRSKTGMTHTL